MSYLKARMSTLPSGEVDIQMKSECTHEELKSLATYLVNESMKDNEIDAMINALKGMKDVRTSDTEEDN